MQKAWQYLEYNQGGFSGQLPPRQQKKSQKRQQTDPKLLCGSLILQIPEGKLKFRGSDYLLFNSETEFQIEIQSDLWLMWSWGPCSEEQHWQGFIPAAIPPWEHIPNTLSSLWCWTYCVADLENIALRGVADAQVEHCPSGHLEAVLWKAKECCLKSQAQQKKGGKHNISAHPTQLEWSVEGEQGSSLVKSHIKAGETTHWIFLPLSGEAQCKDKTIF